MTPTDRQEDAKVLRDAVAVLKRRSRPKDVLGRFFLDFVVGVLNSSAKRIEEGKQ